MRKKVSVAILRNLSNKNLKKPLSGFGKVSLPKRNDIKIVTESITDICFYKLSRIRIHNNLTRCVVSLP
jgi:hypothetical protein